MRSGPVVKSEEAEESKLGIVSEEEEESSEDDDAEEEVGNNTSNTTADTSDTSITRPDEDTIIPTATAIAPDPLDPKCLFGPQNTIPENILAILDGWHKKYPRAVPPCAYRSGIPKRPWKVFDRSGKEVSFSMFTIKKPIPYQVTFIHVEDGSGKLVACRPYCPTQVFLIGWNGQEKGYDEEICAVRLFGKSHEEIVFTPRCFDKAPGPKLEAATPGAAADGSSTDQNTTRPNRRGRSSGVRKSGSGIARPKNKTGSETASESSSSDESSGSDGEDIAAPAIKRPRNRNSNSDAHFSLAVVSPPATSTNTNEVAFKLVSELSDATRCFPITECKSSRDLFAKARKFFRLIDEELEVNVLSCRIPSKHERRYLFEGSQGEFNLLIHDVRNLQGVSTRTLIIEVKCME